MKTRNTIANEEATRDPIFLLQSKHIICTNLDKYEYDSDLEKLVDSDGRPVTNQYLLANEDAVEIWQTESVWFSREEAEAYGQRKKYHYPDGWRVFCLCAEGILIQVLNTKRTNIYLYEAIRLIDHGIALMTPDQLAQWQGVRAWRETVENAEEMEIV